MEAYQDKDQVIGCKTFAEIFLEIFGKISVNNFKTKNLEDYYG